MTSRDFCFWLQGLFELGVPKALDESQTDSVRRHLAMVFLHEIDPSAGGPEKQAALNQMHTQTTNVVGAGGAHGSGGPQFGGVTNEGKVMRC